MSPYQVRRIALVVLADSFRKWLAILRERAAEEARTHAV